MGYSTEEICVIHRKKAGYSTEETWIIRRGNYGLFYRVNMGYSTEKKHGLLDEGNMGFSTEEIWVI